MASPPNRSILDPSTIDAIRASTTATCVVLDPKASLSPPVSLGSARELTFEQLSELKRMVLDPESWFFAKKRCLPRAAAQFRLQCGGRYVTIAIYRPCAGWIVTGPRRSWGAFFDPVQDQIWAMLKALFPEYASASRRSMWRVGAIDELRAAGESVEGS